ncbi:hypothetical protein AAVH_01898 [Aphelenchoides avenae]|nr:hypothetical protein AAVH_01898 [Aphelenchus avenae]
MSPKIASIVLAVCIMQLTRAATHLARQPSTIDDFDRDQVLPAHTVRREQSKDAKADSSASESSEEAVPSAEGSGLAATRISRLALSVPSRDVPARYPWINREVEQQTDGSGQPIESEHARHERSIEQEKEDASSGEEPSKSKRNIISIPVNDASGDIPLEVSAF